MSMEPTVYETEDVEETEVSQPEYTEASNEDIYTNTTDPSDALEAFVTVGKETSAEARIQRIAREIAELRAEVGSERVLNLEQSLLELVSGGNSGAKSASMPAKIHDLDQDAGVGSSKQTSDPSKSPEFQRLEQRVAKLEERIGIGRDGSAHSATPIMLQLNSMRQKLAILTANPSHIDTVVEHLTKRFVPAVQQAKGADNLNRLYDRLQSLEPLIQVLPHVVARLQTLRGIHAEAVTNAKEGRQTEHTLAAMRRDIADWRGSLERIEHQLGIGSSGE